MKNVANRITKAIMAGWGFQGLRFNKDKCQRHALWVSSPKDNGGWRCHKVDSTVSKEDYLNALLDEAGVPK